MDAKWWHLDVQEAAAALRTDPAGGLTIEEAARRLAETGPNRLREKKGRAPFLIFLEQFNNLTIWILLAAALISGFLHEWVDTAAIAAIVVLNAILGFIQEYRAERSLAALKKLSSPSSRVTRGGQMFVIPSENLVPGDVIHLEAGDRIPADGRVFYVTPQFAVQEAGLTGESAPVLKTVRPVEEKDVPLAERVNMVYTGTSVVAGKTSVLVTETAMNTELGRIAGMIQEVRETTPLQRKLEEFGKWIVYACIVIVAVVFLLGTARGGRIIDIFLLSVSLAVAAIPEGLPAIVTISLALGVQRMVKRHALIRKLPSVETLGCATVICSDKTGTLTRNEMTVQAVYTGNRLFSVGGIGYVPEGQFTEGGRPAGPDGMDRLIPVLRCGVLCNGAELSAAAGGPGIVGDPTEGALIVTAAKAGLDKKDLEEKFPFVEEIPFDAQRKKMTIIRRDGEHYAVFTKGAPDILIADCSSYEADGRTVPLDEPARREIARINGELAGRAMRVLAAAYKRLSELPGERSAEAVEQDMVFLGLFAMIDPPREEVKDAITQCRNAGIRTVMITGDHKNTATAVARELGFFTADSIALTGGELDALDEESFSRELPRISVYARVSPEHKLRIVRAWKERGDVVAMTGDGVNDAPAVKEADIGVAMGITGTDVTKEVSDMIVTDDNFASIVAAVEEGRGIYDNIRKFIHYLLSCNTGEILVIFTAVLFGLPAPLLPIHILWVNLVTDGLPALALSVDPASRDIMRRPPRRRDDFFVSKRRAFVILGQGVLIALCSLAAFLFALMIEKEGLTRARTLAFLVLACSQIFHSFNCRSDRRSIFRLGLLTNPQLLLASAASFLLLLGVVYFPFLKNVFKVDTLTITEWILVVVLSSFPLWTVELTKLIRGKGVVK